MWLVESNTKKISQVNLNNTNTYTNGWANGGSRRDVSQVPGMFYWSHFILTILMGRLKINYPTYKCLHPYHLQDWSRLHAFRVLNPLLLCRLNPGIYQRFFPPHLYHIHAHNPQPNPDLLRARILNHPPPPLCKEVPTVIQMVHRGDVVCQPFHQLPLHLLSVLWLRLSINWQQHRQRPHHSCNYLLHNLFHQPVRLLWDLQDQGRE